jgi:hypothetical protein
MLDRIIRQLSVAIAISIAIVGIWASIQTVDVQASMLAESKPAGTVLLADVGTPTTEAKPSLVEQVKTLTEPTVEEAAATAKAEKKAAKAEAKKAKKLAKAEAKKAKELAKAEAKKAKKLAKAEAKAAKTSEKTALKSESES